MISIAGQHETTQTVFEDCGVEVQQQSNGYAAEAQVSYDLRLMDRQQAFDRFQLQNKPPFDNYVQAVPALQSDGFVDNRQCDLPLKRQLSMSQFVAQAFFVCRFQ